MSRVPRTCSVSPRANWPGGFTYRGLLFALPVVVAVPLVAGLGLRRLSMSSEESGPMMHTVERGRFIHDITERGNVESANNVEIRCEVESHGAGTMILWVIDEGTYVTPDPDWEQEDHPGEDPPDLLVRLDSSALEDRLIQQQITCNSSKASVISAKNNFETAKIAKEEYEKGKFQQAKLAVESKIFVAKEDLRMAEDTLKFNKEQLAMGYVTELQVQADEFRVEKANKDLLEAETDLKVLEDYTYGKQLGELDSAIAIAEARLESEEHSHKLDLEKLAEIQEEIDNCAVRAPEPGQVVYANVTDRRGGAEIVIEEGTMVRERQVIIRLPDPKNMQVKAKINEARVAMVEVGMPTTIQLDAFADLPLRGEVEKVNEYPLPTSWFAGSVKEYETIVKIIDFPKDLEMRAGMTAEVKIRVERLDDQLLVPVQAVFEHGGKHYCVLRKGEELKSREVVIGSTNDKEVVIQKGLQEGEKVVMGAALYRDELGLPKLAPQPKTLAETPGDLPGGMEAKTPAGGLQTGAPEVGAGQPGAPAPERPGGAKRDPSQMFSAMDQNGDGRLEGDEIPETIKPNLSAIDTNQDGAVDRSEFNALIQRMRGMRGAGRPGAGQPGGPGGGPGMGGRKARPGGQAPGAGGRPTGAGGGQGARS